MSDLLDLKNIETDKFEEPLKEVEVFSAIPEEVSWESVRTVSELAHKRRHILIAVIAVLGTIVAIWQSSWLTFFVIALGLMAWEVADRFTYPIKASADHQGMTLNGRHYPYGELTSFDIHKMPDEAYELSLKTNHWHIPHLRIPMGEQDPEEIYALLSQYVLNERHSAPFLDYWLRR